MMQYPITFDDAHAFDVFLKKLQLIIRRWRHYKENKPDNRPLSDRERKALDVISKQVQRQIAISPANSRQIAQATITEAMDVMGTRGYLDIFLMPIQIMGVPYSWFVVNALICLIAFIVTNNFIVLFFAAPVVHAMGYFICQPRLKQQREESIAKLLGEA